MVATFPDIVEHPDPEFQAMPGVRILEWRRRGGLLVGTLDSRILLLRDGEVEVERTIMPLEPKSWATARIRGLAESEDGRVVFTGCGTHLYALDGETLDELWFHRAADHSAFVASSVHGLTRLGSCLFVSYDSGFIETRSLSGDLIRSRRESRAPRWAFAWPDQGWIVGADSTTVTILDIDTLKPVRIFQPRATIHGCAFEPGFGLLALRVDDEYRFYDASTGERDFSFPAPIGVPNFDVSAEGNSILAPVGSKVGEWGTDGQLEREWVYPDRRPISVKIDPLHRECAVGFEDGGVEFAPI